MELEVKDFNAKSLGEFLGLTQEEVSGLARRNAPAFLRYVKQTLSEEGEAGYEENLLFHTIINNCETLQQALFLSFNFKTILETLLNQTVDNFVKQN